jgi:Fe-S-cluster containining protein
MIIKLNKQYPSIHGLPVIHSVDTAIFGLTYFMHCMQCTFCKDQCCEWGADIDLVNVKRIMECKDRLELFTGIKAEEWFDRSVKKWDHEYPGGDYTRTAFLKEKNYCVFHDNKTRGCMLHSFALHEGMDFRELKPFFCSMFPVTFDEGVLCVPEEIEESLTACLGDGPALYTGARDAIRYYFGDEIIVELDRIEKSM